ncbi:sigma-54-dependent transcriptional regulator [Pelagibius marinus]|uniref:sigma-54-dependent transcriptional regulator n=1 Tax=Pelagibius marinus TaxID=2762760 RepID=UPI0018730739|nr:sigma-54 dependent transcriptional regulator [Pelagibius marinus]
MREKETPGYRILVVDDDREMRDSLNHLLGKAGWLVETLASGVEAEARIAALQPDVVLSDVRMPGMSGLDLLRRLVGAGGPPVVLISAHGDIPMAVEAMSDGAYTFLEKPFDPRRLLTALRHAAEHYRLRQDTARLRARLARLSDLDRILLGDTKAMQDLRVDVLDLGETDATVMLLGETGTGKELVARALHDLSPRAPSPFIAVNCAAIPDGHFEDTMFGNAEGLQGTLAAADGGTLFLDEIGAFPPAAQAKLLRAIETREFLPVGATQPVSSDFRLVSASNEQLDAAVAEGKFREDLLYRLNTVVLSLPPLRERREDIPLLFQHFAAQNAASFEIDPPDMTAEDLAALLSHDWPGNVRELRHVAERRVLAARRGRGSVADAISLDNDSADVPETLREAVAVFERQLIAKAIQTHKGRMDAVAEALGIGRRTLNEKIVKLGLKKADLI